MSTLYTYQMGNDHFQLKFSWNSPRKMLYSKQIGMLECIIGGGGGGGTI